MTGLDAPLAPCTPEAPCTALGDEVLDGPMAPPTCATTDTDRPAYDDGSPRAFVDGVTGQSRYACVYVPDDALARPRPLVVFLHGSHGDASDVYDFTSLRGKAESFVLGDDPDVPGFVLVSVQGRNIHWVGENPAGAHHDFYFRDLLAPSCNPDVRNLDGIIDTLVAEGGIDPDRIYLTGWSNGGFFASAYAIARHERPTLGGHRVAAASVYASADPFRNIDDVTAPSCRLVPYPTSSVAIQLVHRACDALVPCDAAHHIAGTDVGSDVSSWASALAGPIGATVQDYLLATDGSGRATGCAASCGDLLGSLAHVRWPDGVADGSGLDREPDMLGFLRDHPL